MNSYFPLFRRSVLSIVFIIVSATASFAQQSSVDKERAIAETAAYDRWWYTVVIFIAAVVAGGFFLWRRGKNEGTSVQYDFDGRFRETDSDDNDVGVDAEKELEWYRKAKTAANKAKNYGSVPPILSQNGLRNSRMKLSEMSDLNGSLNDFDINSRAFQEKMKQIQFSQLPIHSFLKLSGARSFEKLPISADPDLLCAVEQANEEFEEDEAVRDLAVRILSAFRTANSVEALSQIALYDLSSNLRSKSVNILADFDHESVFETILLACADPTREVRAAAARGLFRLSFDRAEAWKRLISTNDEYRMRHAARAAIESGIALKSFDRLLHEDMKIAFESVAMVGLLIKSGEHELVFDAIQNHKDVRVRLALLHVLKVVKDERTLGPIEAISKRNDLPSEVSEKIEDTLNTISSMAIV